MNTEILNKWSKEAWAVEAPLDTLGVPFYVLAGEALDVVRFARRYWDPGFDESGNVSRPGLSSAVGAGRFTNGIADEVQELHDALQAAQSKYKLAVNAPDAAPVDRAQFAIREMREVLHWYFDDGEEAKGDAQLAELTRTHQNALSHDALAAALFDYAALADMHRTAITGLGGFDASIIDNAPKIAMALRERSAGPATFEPPPDVQQALELRNRIATLLFDRMGRVRTAAQFVFRKHPAIVRQVTSAYERTQRAARRRHERENGVETADTVETPAVEAVSGASEAGLPSGSAGVGLPGSNPFVSS